MSWMFKRLVDSNEGSPSVEFKPVNINQTIIKGDVVILSAGKLTKASNGPTGGTVWGVAAESLTTGGTVDDDDRIQVIYGQGVEWMVPFYYAGAKTTFAATDIGTAYDIRTNHDIDPNDTTGGFAILVGYDNTNHMARVVMKNSVLALA